MILARKTEPMSLKVLSGKRQGVSKQKLEARKQVESELKLPKDKLKPPKWLGDLAKKEFRFIVAQADSIDLLNNLDLHVLAIYCDTYEKYVDCSQIIQRDGLMTDQGYNKETERELRRHGKLVEAERTKDYGLGQHPLLIRQKDLFNTLKSLQSELGLTPVARAKIAMDKAYSEAPVDPVKERFANL